MLRDEQRIGDADSEQPVAEASGSSSVGAASVPTSRLPAFTHAHPLARWSPSRRPPRHPVMRVPHRHAVADHLNGAKDPAGWILIGIEAADDLGIVRTGMTYDKDYGTSAGFFEKPKRLQFFEGPNEPAVADHLEMSPRYLDFQFQPLRLTFRRADGRVIHKYPDVGIEYDDHSVRFGEIKSDDAWFQADGIRRPLERIDMAMSASGMDTLLRIKGTVFRRDEVQRAHGIAMEARLSDPKDVRRNLARTVRGVLTTDGVVHDNITYRWNREGVTQTLSSNLAAQAFSKRLEGTAKCDVWLRVFDWNLDVIEIMDEAGNDFVELWSDDPDYTLFLTRFEHRFHQSCMIEGSTGAQTAEQRALRRAESLQQQWEDLHNLPYAIAKKAGAVLERAEVRAKARNVADDPDLTDFSAFMIPTDLGGTQRADVPLGPTQSRSADGPDEATDTRADMNRGPAGDWGGLDPAPRSNLDMLVADQEQEDLDGGIDWDADDDRRSEDSSTGDDA